MQSREENIAPHKKIADASTNRRQLNRLGIQGKQCSTDSTADEHEGVSIPDGSDNIPSVENPPRPPAIRIRILTPASRRVAPLPTSIAVIPRDVRFGATQQTPQEDANPRVFARSSCQKVAVVVALTVACIFNILFSILVIRYYQSIGILVL